MHYIYIYSVSMYAHIFTHTHIYIYTHDVYSICTWIHTLKYDNHQWGVKENPRFFFFAVLRITLMEQRSNSSTNSTSWRPWVILCSLLTLDLCCFKPWIFQGKKRFWSLIWIGLLKPLVSSVRIYGRWVSERSWSKPWHHGCLMLPGT